MSEAVEVYEAHPMTLVGTPDGILAEATVAANALMSVVKKAGLAHNFGGKKDHLEFEAWQTLAKFYGESVECVEVRFVQYGSAQGFEAASIVKDRFGNTVSRAEAMCLNDEEKWKSKPKYAYVYVCKDGSRSIEDPGKDQIVWENRKPKKERAKISDEPVPLFQLKSMAQTRANAKALKNRFAWIVVLAGYSATPAEEMTAHDDHDNPPPPEEKKPPMQPPQEKKDKQSITDPDAPASDAQVKAIHAMFGKLGLEDNLIYAYCADVIGKDVPIASTKDLTKGQASDVIDRLNRDIETKKAQG
jgi:hypothetical protein